VADSRVIVVSLELALDPVSMHRADFETEDRKPFPLVVEVPPSTVSGKRERRNHHLVKVVVPSNES
jgi:hypothetical protein